MPCQQSHQQGGEQRTGKTTQRGLGRRQARSQGGRIALRIAGHDDHPLARYACPPLTTVAQDYAEIARIAMNRLLVMLDERDPQDGEDSDQVLLKAALMLRFSA